METYHGNFLNLSHRLFICSFAVLVSLVLAVSGAGSTDTVFNNGGVDTEDLKTLWDIYLLPRLQFDLNQKASQWLEEHMNRDQSANYDYSNGKDLYY